MSDDGSVMDHVRFLSETIGPRPVGSAAYHRAGDAIRAAFRRAGFQLEELRYDCIDWQHHETVLEQGGERLTAAANVFSPPCDVTAPTVAVSTPAELEAADITGRIVIFSGDLSAEPLIPLNLKVYNAERDQRINRLLAERAPLAVIAVNLNPPAVDSRIEDADQPVPSATVPAEVGLRLLERAGEPVRLRVDAERRPGQAATILGLKDGPSPARLTLMAHYDTKIDTPGAWDNASGAAALLALASALGRKDLPVGLELIAFGDEEYYAYSDAEYVEQRGEQMKDIVLAINMDGIGHRLGANTIALMTASERLKERLDGVLAGYPGVIWRDPWPQSNHSTFVWRGVPSIAFNSSGLLNMLHQPGDTARWLDEGKLNEVIALVLDIILAVQDQPPDWTRA